MPLNHIAYKNASGGSIPSYGVMQHDGTMATTSTGGYALNMVAPGKGKGPYYVDDGKGTASSGDGRYGSCYAANEGAVWLAFTGTAPVAGQPIGPARSSFQANRTGGGFLYCGIYDGSNGRVLATKWDGILSAKTTANVAAASLTSGAALTVNVWYPDTTSGASPVPFIVTTIAGLLGLSTVWRSTSALTSNPVFVKIKWEHDACEWSSTIWADCP